MWKSIVLTGKHRASYKSARKDQKSKDNPLQSSGGSPGCHKCVLRKPWATRKFKTGYQRYSLKSAESAKKKEDLSSPRLSKKWKSRFYRKTGRACLNICHMSLRISSRKRWPYRGVNLPGFPRETRTILDIYILYIYIIYILYIYIYICV